MPRLLCLDPDATAGSAATAPPFASGSTLPDMRSGLGLVLSPSVPWGEFVPGLWEYVIPEDEEEEKKVNEKVISVTSKNSVEKVPEDPVTNLAALVRLHGL